MSGQLNREQLQQLAVETILSSSSLTDELTDEEARLLIAWGTAQARAVARKVASQAFATTLPNEDIREILTNRLTPIRRTMKLINNLVAERYDLSSATMTEELEYLHELAGRLPNPPSDLTDETLAELAAQQTDMDNITFMSAVLASLATESPPKQKTIEMMSETGDDHDKEKADTSQPSDIAERGDSDRPAPDRPLPPADHRRSGPRPI